MGCIVPDDLLSSDVVYPLRAFAPLLGANPPPGCLNALTLSHIQEGVHALYNMFVRQASVTLKVLMLLRVLTFNMLEHVR